MPDVNSTGKVAHGKINSCLDNVEFDPDGGLTSWYSPTVIVYRREASPPDHTIALYDTVAEATTDVQATDATLLFGSGGGHWVAWDATNGLVASSGWTDPTADALFGIGPTGEIAYTPDGTLGVQIRRTNGTEYHLTDGPADDMYLVDEGQIIWQEANVLKTFGLPNALRLNNDIFSPKAVLVNGEWWISYVEDDPDGHLVIHPFNSLTGYRFTEVPQHDWYDIAVLASSPSTIRLIWSNSSDEGALDINTEDIDTDTDERELLGSGDVTVGSGPGVNPTAETVGDDGSRIISSAGSFGVAAAAEAIVYLTLPIYPTFPTGQGRGRIVHPYLGAFDYEVKPDEWVNIDADAIIAPIWASSRTLTSAANVLWQGALRDVMVEERWKALGGLAMPMTQMRMLMAIWTNPIDPDVGYVQWYPNYITEVGYKVLPVGLSSGGQQGLVFDDVVNYKDEDGEPIGWITAPVTFTLKIVERL